MANGNDRLAEKLRSQYRNRGASLNGVGATSTSELMKRAQMGRDPKVNVSAQAFDDRINGRTFREGPSREGPFREGPSRKVGRRAGEPGNAGNGRTSQRGTPLGSQPSRGTTSVGGDTTAKGIPRSAAGGTTRGTAKGTVGGTTRGTAGGATRGAARNEADRRTPSAGGQAGTSASGGTRWASVKRGGSETASFAKEPLLLRFFAGVKQVYGGHGRVEEEPLAEIRVERKRIPVSFLAVLLFCTVMIMLILTSLAQVYQTTREISDKEDTVITLKETIDDLKLELDEKNDIRMIEQIAMVELGMVKGDTVQRKYISLSDGERVDLVNETEADEGTGGSAVLSGFFELFGGFFEYFK